MMKGKKIFKWTKEGKASFKKIKTAIVNQLLQDINQLKYPKTLFNTKYQESLMTQLIIDASPYWKHKHLV